jgi:DNA-binding winged helix-turn-helix (wHTH) protein
MRYLIDQFEVDSDRYELRRDGSVEAVEPLVFNLILFLARNPNRVISRDEVIEAVWSGRVVSDATVASAIKSARRALGDSGDSQNFIRTVRGRGFEFQAEVLTIEHPKTSAVSDNLTPQPSPVAADDPKSILVVLPFTNLSAETDEYFADGLTEDIITTSPVFAISA